MHVILLSIFIITAAAQTVGPDVQIRNLRLFYGEDEYFIKGVPYSPSPLSKVMDKQLNGTGYCTPHKYVMPHTTTQEIISPCHWDDYMDGTSYEGGPSGNFLAMWQRDFPMLQSLGVNTLRTYNALPTTQLSINNDPRYTDKTMQGSNHIPFLDMAHQYGFKVLFPLYSDQGDVINATTVDDVKYYITTLIDEVGYHPAILMYSLGNEFLFWESPSSLLDTVNDCIDFARNYQQKKWGRLVPITVPLIDYPPYYDQMAAQLRVDVMTANVYRGFDFGDLWSGNSDTKGWQSLSCSSGKPFLIGEMGVRGTTPSLNVTSWFPGAWSDMLNHKNQGAVGGFLFGFQEEHWKGVTNWITDWTDLPDVHMGIVGLTPGTPGQFPVDNLFQKSGGAYDYNAAISAFAQNQWTKDGPNDLNTVPANFCSGPAAVANCTSPMIACGTTCYTSDMFNCTSGITMRLAQISAIIPLPSTTASTTPIQNVGTTSAVDAGSDPVYSSTNIGSPFSGASTTIVAVVTVATLTLLLL